MITTTNINEVRKEIQKLKIEGKEIIVQADGDDFNRKLFENKDVDMIVGLEFGGKDRLKQRDSGLNEVLCKLAKQNDIKIGIDLGKLVSLDKIEKSRVLARVRQNIGLCKRVGCRLVIIPNGEYKKQDVLSLFLTFGGSTQLAKKSL